MNLYQNLNLNGQDLPSIDPNRKNSLYWNEGKWNNFIKPLLPKGGLEDMTFVDMGCNAGLFLKMAKDYGFRNVIGVEKSRSTYKEGIKYRDSIGYDYRILNQTVGVDFNIDNLPVADVTLMCNFHYYLHIGDFLEYLDKLRWKTVYCLVVTSDHNSPSRHWRASGLVADVRNYFRDWQEVGAIYRAKYGSMIKNDPAPRKLWSILFKSNLRRVSIKDLKWGASGSLEGKRLLRDEISDMVARHGYNFDISKTQYYKTWKERYNLSDEDTNKFVIERIKTMNNVKENGLTKPIWIQLDNKIIDGGHRVAIMESLGYKSIIGRSVLTSPNGK